MAGICSKHQGYDPSCNLCNAMVNDETLRKRMVELEKERDEWKGMIIKAREARDKADERLLLAEKVIETARKFVEHTPTDFENETHVTLKEVLAERENLKA